MGSPGGEAWSEERNPHRLTSDQRRVIRVTISDLLHETWPGASEHAVELGTSILAPSVEVAASGYGVDWEKVETIGEELRQVFEEA